MIDIPCIIFAGGKSSRMGEDKALLPFGEFSTLTEFQLTRLKMIFKTVYISCKNREKFTFDTLFIEDIDLSDIYAPTLGFISIFEKLQEERFFVISVDTPFIGVEEIVKLVENDTIYCDATIAKTEDGIQPLCGIYHRSLELDFKNMVENGTHQLGFLLKKSKTNFILFYNSSSFINLNKREDYIKALGLYSTERYKYF